MEDHEIEAVFLGFQFETVYLPDAIEFERSGYYAVSRPASSSRGFEFEDEATSSSSSSAALVREEDCDHRFKLQKKESPRFSVTGIGEDYINAAGGSCALEDKSNGPGFEEIMMGLNDDILHMVFSFLERVDLCCASLVCKRWYAASTHEDLWRSLNFKNRNISPGQFGDICRRYPNATEVNISGVFVINSLVLQAVSSLRNLDRLTLGKQKVHKNFFELLTGMHSLRNFTINDATIGNDNEDILISHDRMRHLQMVKCRLFQISVRCPRLETLSLKHSHMLHAELSCPLVHDLDISNCLKLTAEALISTVSSCPLLESLDISNCPYFSITDGTLREIASNCSSLQFLDVSYCHNISFESVRFLMLTVLKLHCCDRITSASMASFGSSSMLEVLELVDCNLLTSVSLDLAHLKTIRLVHCLKLVDLNLCSILLTSITVLDCASLLSISLKSNLLNKLDLPKQEVLTTLALQCQSLQELDLTDCESLTNSICDVLSDGGCPMLRSLVLDNCEGLTDVVFRNTSLITLSLAGCRRITSLNLACPRLEKISLDGCDELEIASFCPVDLQSLNLGIFPKLSVLQIESPSMVVLEMKGCGLLTKASISCPILNSIDASYCSQLKDISATTASCPQIETLILMSCPSIGPDGLSSLCQLSRLTSLDLSYSHLIDLHPLFDSCLQLKVLKLQACKYVPDSSLKPLYNSGGAFPNLFELDLSYGNISQSSIDDLLACCTQLTHLSLNGCVNMHVLNWGFNVPTFGSQLSTEQPNRLLQSLNCVGCPNIKEVRIPTAARCFNLLSLNLSVSANLKEVDLACPNLSCLNLSNCYSLEVLKLDCPKLTILSLQSSNIDEETIEAAISECRILEKLDVRFCRKLNSLNMASIRAACPKLKCIFSSLSSSLSIC